MVNIYQCDGCGVVQEIPEGHEDNNDITVSGIKYIEHCRFCDVE